MGSPKGFGLPLRTGRRWAMDGRDWCSARMQHPGRVAPVKVKCRAFLEAHAASAQQAGAGLNLSEVLPGKNHKEGRGRGEELITHSIGLGCGRISSNICKHFANCPS